MTAQDWDAKAREIIPLIDADWTWDDRIREKTGQDRTVYDISTALASAYAAGQEQMREEAAQVAGDSFGRLAIARAIRALPAAPPGQSEGDHE